ncbi:MAG: hypothetical protein K6E32_03165 [Lachnospiraceae bacterium]|nr:hypothetical protein [Lachnospiraceae bacterium]
MRKSGLLRTVTVLLTVVSLGLTACESASSSSLSNTVSASASVSGKDTDTSASSSTETTVSSTETSVSEEKEPEPVVYAPLEGSYWVTADPTEETAGIELFLFEDGSFYYREPLTLESGLEGYDVFFGTKLTWNVDGDTIILTQKWGYAAEDSDEDISKYLLNYADDRISFEDIKKNRGTITLKRGGEMPVLPSVADASKLPGKWKMIASELEGEIEAYVGEDPWVKASLEIKEQDGKYTADYKYVVDGKVKTKWNDVGMTFIDEPLYSEFKNGFWSALLDDVPKAGEWYKIALYDDNILAFVKSNYGIDEMQDYIYISYSYFVRDDENADANARAFLGPEFFE